MALFGDSSSSTLPTQPYPAQTSCRHHPIFNNLDLRKESSCLRGRSGGGTAATAEATTELGVELARGGTLLALAGVAAAVLAALTVATGTTTAATGALLTTEHTARGSVGTLLLDVGLGNDLGGEVEPLAEVVKALGGEAVENVSVW